MKTPHLTLRLGTPLASLGLLIGAACATAQNSPGSPPAATAPAPTAPAGQATIVPGASVTTPAADPAATAAPGAADGAKTPSSEFCTTHRFAHVPMGARKKRGGSFPNVAMLYPAKPDGITKEPAGLVDPIYGTVRIPMDITHDPLESKHNRRMIVDRGADGTYRFFVDANDDGDFTNDPTRAAPAGAPLPQIAGILKNPLHGFFTIGGREVEYAAGLSGPFDLFYLYMAIPEKNGWKQPIGGVFEAPPRMANVPSGLSSPLFGTARFGVREKPRSHWVIVDRPEGKPVRLFLDSNANGRFDDEPVQEMTLGETKDPTKFQRWTVHAKIEMKYEKGPGISDEGVTIEGAALCRYEVRPNAPVRLAMMPEWGREGTVNINGLTLMAMLFDDMATGDYRGSLGGNDPGIRFLIDTGVDGEFGREDSYPIGRPFQIFGPWYQVKDMAASGESFRIEPAAEPPPPKPREAPATVGPPAPQPTKAAPAPDAAKKP